MIDKDSRKKSHTWVEYQGKWSKLKIQCVQVETKPSKSPGWQVAGSLVGRLLIRLCHQAPTVAHHGPPSPTIAHRGPGQARKRPPAARKSTRMPAASSNVITWYFLPFRWTAINSKHQNLNSTFLVPTKKVMFSLLSKFLLLLVFCVGFLQ